MSQKDEPSQSTTSPAWSSTQAYVLAVVCLLLGVAPGLIGASHNLILAPRGFRKGAQFFSRDCIESNVAGPPSLLAG